MASVSIQLTHPNSEISSLVCQLRDGRTVKIKVPAQLSVKPKHWKNGRVHSADNHASVKNVSLDNLKDRVLEIYLEAKSKGIKPNARYIKEALTPKIESSTSSNSFWKLWEAFLEDKKKRFAPNSFVKFNSLKGHLVAFENDTKLQWNLDRVDRNLLEKLQGWMYEKDLSTRTVSKYIGVFKMFLNWAAEYGYTDNADFRKFKPIRAKDTLKVILEDHEIMRIKNAEFEAGGFLANARDLLLLSVDTGLRYSDYSRIKREHLKADRNGKPYIRMMQQKTKDYINIPLTEYSHVIVEKLINGELRSITNQKLNKYVKEVCRQASVDEPFEIHRFKGKLEVHTSKPKWELITTHVGRRTCATRLLMKGMPPQAVMKITGHKDYKSFAKYVNIPEEAHMEMIRKALES